MLLRLSNAYFKLQKFYKPASQKWRYGTGISEQIEKLDQQAIHTLKEKISELEARGKKLDLFLAKFVVEELQLETIVIQLIQKFKEISLAIDNKENEKVHALIAEFLKGVDSLKDIDEKLEKDEEPCIEGLKSEKKLFKKIEKLEKRYIKDENYFTKPLELKELLRKITLFVIHTDSELNSLISAWTKMKTLIEKTETAEKKDFSKIKSEYSSKDKDSLKSIFEDIVYVNVILTKNIDTKRKRLSDFLVRCKNINNKLDSLSNEVDIDIHKMLEEI